MLELTNTTPFAVGYTLNPNINGVDTLYTMVKATLLLGDRTVLHDEQLPLSKTDVFWGEPENSSLKSASDYHLGKPGTDIVVLGDAMAVDRTPTTQLDVLVQVADVQKSLRVWGDRNWDGQTITSPVPFDTMPIIYERAYGGDGSKPWEGEHAPILKNPAGVGYDPEAESAGLAIPLPNIECPSQLIDAIHDRPEPAGIGYIAPHWLARHQYVGTYDTHWRRHRAPYLPQDFDSKFFNVASPGMISAQALMGGEPFLIDGMHVDGPWQGTIPRLALKCSVQVALQTHQVPFQLETVVFHPNRKCVEMVWRSALVVDKQAQKVSHIQVELQRQQQAVAV